MIDRPFRIFEPYADRIDIRLHTKSDQRLDEQDLVSLNQVHGKTTIIARSPSRREKEADGVLTDQPDLWLSIRVADCQAFVIYTPEQNVIGLLHAGWKGLINGAIPAFFEQMQQEWDIDVSTVLIGAAPSLCTACAEFSDPVTELTGIDSRFFYGRNADLCGAANDQWMQCGILPEHIERHPDCTKCRDDLYWSYRGKDKEQIQQGWRNVLAVKLKIDN